MAWTVLPAGTSRSTAFEETDELLVAMALHVAADHGSVEDVHGGEQGGRSVPLVIMGHRSSTALLHRQPGLGAVERLDLAFFVDGQDHGVRRRIDVETDDVAQLVDEFRVLGELELANAVGLQPMRAPDALDRTDADARGLGHRGARPMCDLARRRFHRERNDALSDRGIEFWNARGTSLIAQKAFEALNREAPLPAPNASLGLAGLAHDCDCADALGRQQHDPRPPDVLLRRVTVLHESLKPIHVGRSDRKGNAGAHVADSHAKSPTGILNRIQMSDLIH
jgi:hypothetical protein